MNKEFPEIIKEARNLQDLEDKLSKEGVSFKKRKHFFKYITDQHLANNRERLEAILNSPGKHELPDQVVEVNGVKYHLHGIAHGNPSWLAPGLHARKRLKEEIKEAVKKYGKDGSEFFCEQGLSSYFGIDTFPLTDRGFEFQKPSHFKAAMILPVLLPLALIGIVYNPIVNGGIYVYARINKNTKNPKKALLSVTINALQGLEGQTKIAEFFSVYKLPEPIDLEIQHIKEKSEFLRRRLQTFMKFDTPTTPERSHRTVQKLLKYTRNLQHQDYQVAHYLCGNEHTSQVAYFLRNPDYSFNEIEEYRRRTR